MGTRILWERVNLPGHEISALDPHAGGWRLAGTALFTHESMPCELSYSIQCDLHWQTQSVLIRGHVGATPVNLSVTRSAACAWYSNGVHVPEVDGCIDIDLGFSPSTNLLPIRRLALAIGNRAVVRAAWVRFPELSLEILEQVYKRLDADHYLYESADGSFRKELLVGADGFVLDYPDFWRADAVTSITDPVA
jgi:hypothetical protein